MMSLCSRIAARWVYRIAQEKSFVPPKKVQANARKALEVRESKPDSEKGMTAVGIARARDLSNGKAVSLETIQRMDNYFTRHQSDKKGETWKEQGKGWQAWMGWGGDEGWTWAKGILKSNQKTASVPGVSLAELYFHINNGGVTFAIEKVTTDNGEILPRIKVRQGHFGMESVNFELLTNRKGLDLLIEMLQTAQEKGSFSESAEYQPFSEAEPKDYGLGRFIPKQTSGSR